MEFRGVAHEHTLDVLQSRCHDRSRHVLVAMGVEVDAKVAGGSRGQDWLCEEGPGLTKDEQTTVRWQLA